jgi:hypothetical protein
MQSLQSVGLLGTFSKTDGFKVIIADSDEPEELSIERYNLFLTTGTIKGEWEEPV